MYISNAILKCIDLPNQVSGLNLMGKKTLDLQQMKVLTNKKEETPFIQFPNTPFSSYLNQD